MSRQGELHGELVDDLHDGVARHIAIHQLYRGVHTLCAHMDTHRLLEEARTFLGKLRPK